MNYKMIFQTIGKILIVEAFLLIFPLIVSLIYKENTYPAFLITIGVLLMCGTSLALLRPKNKKIFVRDAFVLVGLSWILLSLFGCLPFFISQEIPNFINAFFETVSGFTTTGASVLVDVESMSKGLLFWRSFTHWIGGMGVLVFVLAILPNSEGQNIYLLRAESTGPQVGKLVSKVKFTARILYIIYLALTMVEFILLLCGGNSVFDSIVTVLATAGTGGFGIYSDSVASFNTYSQIIIMVFMFIFGINFNIFYLILIGKFKQTIKSEELRWYIGIVVTCSIAISLNLFFALDYSIGNAIKHSFFQVVSIITTTGFSTVDFNLWPTFSKIILLIILFIGGCAGSTAGGFKVSRLLILLKSLKREVKKLIHPHSVSQVKFEGESLDDNVVKGVNNYFGLLLGLFVGALILVSLDGLDFTTTFTATATCISNVGPGFNLVGPLGNFDCFSDFSTLILSIVMLIGRLEIYPIIILFMPKVWTGK